MSSSRITVGIIILLLAPTALLIPGAATGTEQGCGDAEKQTVVEKDPDFGKHVKFTFQFSTETGQYCVLVENKGSQKTLSSFDATADGRTVAPEMPTLEPGESKYVEKNVTSHLDVLRDNHTVTLGVFNDTFVYNFTQEFDATSPEVPAPTIRDIEVIRHAENDSTSLRVAVHNPLNRSYGMYVQAKTFGTKRVDDIGGPETKATKNFVLPLEESSDAVIGGKVRIFNDWGNPDSKLDQKEFLSRPGNDTKMWNEPFENMPGTESAASYENETSKQYRAGYVDDDYLSERESKVGAAVAVVLLLSVVWWRRR